MERQPARVSLGHVDFQLPPGTALQRVGSIEIRARAPHAANPFRIAACAPCALRGARPPKNHARAVRAASTIISHHPRFGRRPDPARGDNHAVTSSPSRALRPCTVCLSLASAFAGANGSAGERSPKTASLPAGSAVSRPAVAAVMASGARLLPNQGACAGGAVGGHASLWASAMVERRERFTSTGEK